MRLVIVISLSIVMLSCASGPETTKEYPRPQGVPSCGYSNPYGEFGGGRGEIEGNLEVIAAPYHLNDMMYLMMGQKAEETMVLMNMEFTNKGTSNVDARREDINVVGGNGETNQALDSKQILTLARGSDTKAGNMFEKIGDNVLRDKFVDQITVSPGQRGDIGIAFALPLPPDPKIQVTSGSGTVEILICWSPPGQ